LSGPSIPNPWTINTNSNINGSLDVGLDDIQIRQLPIIVLNSTSTLTSTSELTSKSELTSNSTVDLGLDDIRIKELPPIDLRLQTSMKPTRIHFPLNMTLAICGMGTELLSFSVCGESMVVVEDYVPHRTEECS
jgi:hypothetical protein